MPEYINKTKFLEQLRQELSEIDTVHHDHIDLEKQMYEFVIKKVESIDGEDVISRKSVLNIIDYIRNKYILQYNRKNKCDQFWADTIRHIERKVRGLGSDKSIRKGQWKHVAGMNGKCSECGRYFPVAEFENRPFDINCCPHCGTKMMTK